MSTRISAGVDDCPCFTTFYCYDPPIDCKITNFSLHLFVYFFGNMNDDKFYFRECHMKSSSFAFAYARLLHSVIDREEEEKYPFLSLCGNTGYSLVTVCPHDQLITVKMITLHFQSCLTL